MVSFHWCSPCTYMINSVNHNFNYQNIPLLIMRQKRSLYILLFHYLFNVCTNLKYTLVGMSLQFFISLRMSRSYSYHLFIYLLSNSIYFQSLCKFSCQWNIFTATQCSSVHQPEMYTCQRPRNYCHHMQLGFLHPRSQRDWILPHAHNLHNPQCRQHFLWHLASSCTSKLEL